jgi:hypothetical protein
MSDEYNVRPASEQKVDDDAKRVEDFEALLPWSIRGALS